MVIKVLVVEIELVLEVGMVMMAVVVLVDVVIDIEMVGMVVEVEVEVVEMVASLLDGIKSSEVQKKKGL